MSGRCESAEGKVISLRSRIEELDLELAIHDRVGLPNELVQPRFDNRAVAWAVNISTVSGTRRLSIDRYAKSHGGSSRRWSHDEIEIARVEAERNSPGGLIQHDGLLTDRPVSGKGPVVEVQPLWRNVNARLIPFS